MSEEKNLEGLGGWLILVAIGILASPIRIGAQLYPIYSEIFSTGAWEALTTPGSETYNSLWAPILIGEITINGGLILAWLFLAFLFFFKKKIFPKCYIGILLFTLVFVLVDAFVVKLIIPDDPVFDADTIQELSRALIATVIWVPYMIISKRVKLTFTK